MKRNIFAVVAIGLVLGSCANTSIPKKMDNFVGDAELEFNDYTEKDWNKSIERFDQLVDKYNEREDKYSDSEKKMAAKAILRYNVLLLKNGFSAAGDFLKGLGDIFPSILEGMSAGFSAGMEGVSAGMEGFSAGMEGLLNGLGGFSDGLNKAITNTDLMSSDEIDALVDKFSNSTEEWGRKLGEQLEKSFGNFGSSVEKSVQNMEGSVENAAGSMENALDSLGKMLERMFQSIEQQNE